MRVRASVVASIAGCGWLMAMPALALDKDGYCRDYASAAVASARENSRLKCGYGGTRYSHDRQLHYRWCLSVPREIPAQERDIRRDQMRACRR